VSTAPTRREVEEEIESRIERLRVELASADRSERKTALKEAFKELMQEQLARFGGWTLAAIGTLVVTTLLYVVLYAVALKAGWTPPHQ
jgi:hypothetical protein